jgi:hypothetical protein
VLIPGRLGSTSGQIAVMRVVAMIARDRGQQMQVTAKGARDATDQEAKDWPQIYVDPRRSKFLLSDLAFIGVLSAAQDCFLFVSVTPWRVFSFTQLYWHGNAGPGRAAVFG